MAELMAGPGGVIEIASRVDPALTAATTALADCHDSRACLDEYQDASMPLEDAFELLDAYMRRVDEVSAAARELAAEDPEGGGDAVVSLAQQWRSASLLTVRAAASMLECLDNAADDEFEAQMRRCNKISEMYGASLLEHNRLRADFEHEYLAHTQPQPTTP